LKTLGYVRVSTEEQSREGVSLDMQTAKIQAYCELHGLDLVGIETDAGLSGRSIAGRPGVQAVLERVRKKRNSLKCLVVYKLDRLARNTKEALEIAQLLQKRGVALHSVCEKLDTTNACGELFFALLAAMAQWEQATISERTAAALARKKEKSERVSRFAPYGYRFEGGSVVPEPTEQETIRTIQLLSAQGQTTRSIGPFLAERNVLNRNGKPFGRTEVCRLLQRTQPLQQKVA
jgi:site-specific DNA recombinase